MSTLSQNKRLRAKDCAEYLGIALSTFWKWVKQGKIPAGTRLSSRCTVWGLDTLNKFLEEQENAHG